MDTDGRKLFVAKMPEDIREDEMKIVFGTYGAVQEVVILSPDRSRAGQRCGFVIYETPEAARSAQQVLDHVYKFRETAPEAIHVSFARPRGSGSKAGEGKGAPGGYEQGFNPNPNPGWGGDLPPPASNFGGEPGYGKGGGKEGVPGTKLYVGNLPGDIQREAIDMVFKTYGTVTDIHIMTGKSKSGQACAFVRYANSVEANNAIAAMAQGYEIRPGEGHIIVKLADGPDGKGKGGRPGPY
mmetsp:Transcript_37552/g.70003  ORF Transcript_37552/g.70003 Transcript_37552/m.70003 type:complete len:240 (-) Transcript_37552:133-852(-)